jgi:hypothetical protein
MGAVCDSNTADSNDTALQCGGLAHGRRVLQCGGLAHGRRVRLQHCWLCCSAVAAPGGATLKPLLQAFARMNNPCIEQQVLSFVNVIIHTSGSDVIGLKRNTGSGDEYIFFSKTASNVLTAEELQT